MDGVYTVKIQRLSCTAGFLRTVKHCNRRSRRGKSLDETLRIERSVKPHFEEANLLTMLVEITHRLVRGLAARTHKDYHALGVGGAVILEKTVLPANKMG
jgi:hypothetical protein